MKKRLLAAVFASALTFSAASWADPLNSGEHGAGSSAVFGGILYTHGECVSNVIAEPEGFIAFFIGLILGLGDFATVQDLKDSPLLCAVRALEPGAADNIDDWVRIAPAASDGENGNPGD
jgi:hypothetical protein